MNSQLLTVNETAAILNVSPKTLYRWAAEGVVPAVKIGAAVRFSRERIEQLINDGGRKNA